MAKFLSKILKMVDEANNVDKYGEVYPPYFVKGFVWDAETQSFVYVGEDGEYVAG